MNSVNRVNFTVDQEYYGLITWDDNTDGRLPLCVIDDQAISWEALGRKLMTFEGFNFKLTIHDNNFEQAPTKSK